MRDRDAKRVAGLLRMLADYPEGLTRGEMDELARHYGYRVEYISEFTDPRGSFGPHHYPSVTWSHECAMALAVCLRRGWVEFDHKLRFRQIRWNEA